VNPPTNRYFPFLALLPILCLVLHGATGGAHTQVTRRDDPRYQDQSQILAFSLVVQRGHGGPVTSLEYADGGRRFFSGGGDDGHLILWDSSTGKEIRRFNHGVLGVGSLGYSERTERLISAARGGAIKLWDVSRDGPDVDLGRHNPYSSGITAVSPDGARVLSLGDRRERLQVFDAATLEKTREHPGPASAVTSVAWGADGRSFYWGTVDGRMELWDAATGKPLAVFRGHEGQINAIALDPTGERVYSLSSDGKRWPRRRIRRACSWAPGTAPYASWTRPPAPSSAPWSAARAART